MWFCPECNTKVHEVELQVCDIVEDLPPVFQAFYRSDEGRTCSDCGALHPRKG
jgi:3-hydroxyanthranilate 3,4-dioxygenase